MGRAGAGRLELDTELCEHRARGRKAELPEQPRELLRIAGDADPVAEARQQPDPAQPRLPGVKLPRMDVDDRWPACPLEAPHGPARQPKRVEPEVAAASHWEIER